MSLPYISVFITKGGVFNVGVVNIAPPHRYTAHQHARNAADAIYQHMSNANGPWHLEWVDKTQLYVSNETDGSYEIVGQGTRQEIYHALLYYLNMMRGSNG